MTIADIIKSRRSARNYLDKPVERDKIMACLEAARLAPSAVNSQPWHFVVVDDKKLKDRLCQEAFSGIYAVNSFARKAPVLVAVVSERDRFLTRISEWFRDTRFYLIDIGISCEHFVLQAEELGLGTCWIGWFNEKAVKKSLKIPDSKKVDVLLTLGYSDGNRPVAGHDREPFKKIASFNTYR